MNAVLESGGKQYHVKVGDVITVEKIEFEVGSSVTFDKVLVVGNNIGAPYVKGGSVKAEVLEQKKEKKIIIFKKKRRHNYRRKLGHRQQVSVVRITEISSK